MGYNKGINDVVAMGTALAKSRRDSTSFCFFSPKLLTNKVDWGIIEV